MITQDYLFVALLLVTIAFFIHWGGTHHFRH